MIKEDHPIISTLLNKHILKIQKKIGGYQTLLHALQSVGQKKLSRKDRKELNSIKKEIKKSVS